MSATQITAVTYGPYGVPGVIALAAPDAVNGNYYNNPGGNPCTLLVNNASGGSITITVTMPATPFNGAGALGGATKVYTVPTMTEELFCFEPSIFNNASGQVTFIASTATSVTVGVYQNNRSFL